jgi:glycosyltransferase involved in cell wall biosynthesis
MTPLPDVEVIVPTRDRPALLRSAVRSILSSEYAGDIRVLVVFDQSEPDQSLPGEDGLGIGPGRQVEVLSNGRSVGLAGARNTGLLAAQAELVAFCDDDDVWLPRKLDRQVQALLDNPDAEFVCCGIDVFYDGRSHPRILQRDEVTLTALLRDRLTELHPSTFVMRRKSVVDGFGLVEEEIPGSYAEDYELLLRAARQHPIVNIRDVGVRVLWSKGSYFSNRWSTWRSGLTWLLQRYPEFHDVPAGEARIAGQIAFASAADNDRREGLRWAWRALRRRPTEPRAYLAVAVAAGLPASWVMRRLHNMGRGL